MLEGRALVGHGRAPCSMRCSRCVTACRFPRAARRASLTGPASRETADSCSTSPTSIATPTRGRAAPRSPGPRRRCNCGTSAWTPPRPTCSSNSRDTSCLRAPRRAPPPTISGAARAGPAGLWSQSISGDLPIVLLRVEDVEDLPLVRQLLQAHEYWGIKRLSVDLVILNERGASYIQDLQVALEAAVRISLARPRIAGTDTRGKVFVLRTDLITPETRALLLAVARVVSVGPARQPRRPDRTHAARPHRGTAVAAANAGRGRGHSRSGNRPQAGVLQRTRRLRRAGPRIRDHRDRWPEHSRALDQRDREPQVRIPGRAAMAAVTPGRATAARTRSRPGPTTRSPTARARLSTCATRKPANCGPPAPAPIRHEGARYTLCARHGLQPFRAASRTAFRSSSRCWCRSRIPSRSAGCACATTRRAGAASRSPRMSSGCWARHAPAARRTSSPSWMSSGALFARNPWNQPFPGVAFADLRGAQTEFTCDRHEFLGSPWNARRAGGAGVRRAILGTRRRGTRSVRSAARAHRTRTFVEHGIRIPVRRGGG